MSSVVLHEVLSNRLVMCQILIVARLSSKIGWCIFGLDEKDVFLAGTGIHLQEGGTPKNGVAMSSRKPCSEKLKVFVYKYKANQAN